MKSDFYLESNLPFSSFSDYASVIINLTPDDERYSSCDVFWKSMLGDFYDVNVKYEGYPEEFLSFPVLSFLNESDSMQSFFMRMLHLCMKYVESVQFLESYADSSSIDCGKQECIDARSLVSQCDSIWFSHIVNSPFVHINMDFFNPKDRFEIMGMDKNGVMDILKGRSPICSHYVSFQSRDGIRQVDLTKLSPETVSTLTSMDGQWRSDFSEWMANGKRFPDYSVLGAPDSNNSDNVAEDKPLQITDDDFEEFLASEGEQKGDIGDETAEL